MRLEHRHNEPNREINDLWYVGHFVFGLFRGAHEDRAEWELGLEITYYPGWRRDLWSFKWSPQLRLGRLRLMWLFTVNPHFMYTAQFWVGRARPGWPWLRYPPSRLSRLRWRIADRLESRRNKKHSTEGTRMSKDIDDLETPYPVPDHYANSASASVDGETGDGVVRFAYYAPNDPRMYPEQVVSVGMGTRPLIELFNELGAKLHEALPDEQIVAWGPRLANAIDNAIDTLRSMRERPQEVEETIDVLSDVLESYRRFNP